MLCTAEVEGEHLSFDDLLGFLMQLLGGFKISIDLLSKAAISLAERLELHAALREDSSRVSANGHVKHYEWLSCHDHGSAAHWGGRISSQDS